MLIINNTTREQSDAHDILKPFKLISANFSDFVNQIYKKNAKIKINITSEKFIKKC